MNEIINNLKCDVYNGEKNYCMISEEMLNAIKELSKREKQELQKYKSLYENEKDHTDTLKRIIKKIEEYIKSQEYFYNDDEESGWDCSIDGYKILNLLKEIK